jgi:hypothetical protein
MVAWFHACHLILKFIQFSAFRKWNLSPYSSPYPLILLRFFAFNPPKRWTSRGRRVFSFCYSFLHGSDGLTPFVAGGVEGQVVVGRSNNWGTNFWVEVPTCGGVLAEPQKLAP